MCWRIQMVPMARLGAKLPYRRPHLTHTRARTPSRARPLRALRSETQIQISGWQGSGPAASNYCPSLPPTHPVVDQWEFAAVEKLHHQTRGFPNRTGACIDLFSSPRSDRDSEFEEFPAWNAVRQSVPSRVERSKFRVVGHSWAGE